MGMRTWELWVPGPHHSCLYHLKGDDVKWLIPGQVIPSNSCSCIFLAIVLATFLGQLGCAVTAGVCGPPSCTPTACMGSYGTHHNLALGTEGQTEGLLCEELRGENEVQHWLLLPHPLQCLLTFATPSSLFWTTAQKYVYYFVHSTFCFLILRSVDMMCSSFIGNVTWMSHLLWTFLFGCLGGGFQS